MTAQSVVGARGRATTRWMVLVACALLTAIGGLHSVGVAAGGEVKAVGPTATVSPTQAASGESVVVRGGGYPAGSKVKIAVCSFAPRVSDEQCSENSALTAEVSATGSLAASLVVERPAAPCPCVLWITDPVGSVSVTVPLTLDGVAGPDAVAIEQQGDPQVELTSLTLDGGDSWRSWFGADPSRTALITLTNTGGVAADDPPLLVGLRHSGQLTMVPGVPSVGRLAPGSARTVEVPVDLGVLALGDYTVEAQVLGTGQPGGAIAAATTSAKPWGVLAVLLVVFIALAALMRMLVRIDRRSDPSSSSSAVVSLALAAGTPALTTGAGEMSEVAQVRRRSSR